MEVNKMQSDCQRLRFKTWTKPNLITRWGAKQPQVLFVRV